MPTIKPFDMGEGTPFRATDMGAQAMGAAGAEAARAAAAGAHALRGAADAEGRAFGSIGHVFSELQTISDKAQQNTDLQAQLDAAKNDAVNDDAMMDVIKGNGLDRKDPDGNPLPASTQVYGDNVGTALDQYKTQLGQESEAFAAKGTSKKAQLQFELKQQRRLVQASRAAHAENVAVTTQEMLGNVTTSFNKSIDSAYKHPDQVWNTLGAMDETIGNVTQGLDRVAAKETLGPKMVEAKGKALKAAIYSYAEAGDVFNATQLMNDPRSAPFIGGHEFEIKRGIDSIMNGKDATEMRQMRAADFKENHEINDFVAQVHKNEQLDPGDPHYDKSLTQQAIELKYSGNQLIKARKEYTALTYNVDPDVSNKYGAGLQESIDSGQLKGEDAKQAVLKEARDLHISQAEKTRLLGVVNQAGTAEGKHAISVKKDFFDQYQTEIGGPQLGGVFTNVKGGSAMYLAKKDADRLYAQFGDKIYDPDDSHFIGRRRDGTPSEFLEQHQVSFQQKIKDATQRLGGNKVQTPGQTPAPADAKGNPTVAAAPKPVDVPTVPQGMSYDDVIKNYPIGKNGENQYLMVPGLKPGDPPRRWKNPGPPAGASAAPYQKGSAVEHMGDNPNAPKKMSYTPEGHVPFGVGIPGQGDQPKGATGAEPGPSILAGLDAHTGKNLFSSGRAAQLGIPGGVGQHLVPIAKDPATGADVKVNAQAAPHFQAFLQDLQSRGYKIGSLGGYANRQKRDGYGTSEHAYGNAIDINPGKNAQHGRATDMPANIRDIAAQYGLIWGGDWNGKSRDPMHFEWSGKSGTQTAQNI